MKPEMELNLLAFVDGELPEGESKKVANYIAENQEAQALVAELRMSKLFLGGNEPEVRLPEGREFYWGKIQRAIERGEAAAKLQPRLTLWQAWRKLLAPLAGVALVVFLSVAAINDYDFGFLGRPARHLGEVENYSEHTSSFSFRSHAENMFVVWVYEKNDDSDPDADANDEVEPIVQ